MLAIIYLAQRYYTHQCQPHRFIVNKIHAYILPKTVPVSNVTQPGLATHSCVDEQLTY